MNSLILERLRCPVCRREGTVSENGRSFLCNGTKRHCFDFARSGYLNLSRAAQAGTGDDADAIRARSLFLDGGYYAPLADAICGILSEYRSACVLDAGCGEGYYTDRMARQSAVLGIDLSVAGIDRGAKRAKASGSDAAFAVAGLFTLPVADASFDAVTSIFAPCAEEEFLRALTPGGILILVGAGERHLWGLKQLLYENPYVNAGRRDLPNAMQLLEKRSLAYTVTVEGGDSVAALFSMTPYYWRTSEADREKLNAVRQLTTELDFDIFIFQKETAKEAR